MTPFLSTDTAVAGNFLADPPPVITGAAATGIIRALGLAAKTVDTWTADPNLRARIASGFVEISDDLAGGVR